MQEEKKAAILLIDKQAFMIKLGDKPNMHFFLNMKVYTFCFF